MLCRQDSPIFFDSGIYCIGQKCKKIKSIYKADKQHSLRAALTRQCTSPSLSLFLFHSLTLKLTGDIWIGSLPVIQHNSSFYMRHMSVHEWASVSVSKCMQLCMNACVSAHVCI